MSLNSHFSNVTGTNLSLTGSKSYIIDEAHFTEQECNITADGTLNVCCPIKFKEGFDFDGDICDLDGNATFKGFTAKRNTGYNLVADAATCATLGTSKITNCLIGTIDTGDTTGNFSTRLQAQPTPASLNDDGYIIVYHPDATHTPSQNNGRSLEIRGGTGLNTDILIDSREYGEVTCSAGGTCKLYSHGFPTAPGGGFGDIEIRAGYGEINLTAYGNGPYPGDHQDINIICQQGDVKITPRTPPNLALTPPKGYTYITSLVSTDQSIPVPPYSGPAGQIRIVQDPAGNVYLYASTLQFVTNAVQWSRVLLI